MNKQRFAFTGRLTQITPIEPFIYQNKPHFTRKLIFEGKGYRPQKLIGDVYDELCEQVLYEGEWYHIQFEISIRASKQVIFNNIKIVEIERISCGKPAEAGEGKWQSHKPTASER